MKYICPDCKNQYETGKFCLECGGKLQELAPEFVCPSCGLKVKLGKFCPECGTKLEEQYGVSVATNTEPKESRFNERDLRFAKYYDKKGFPRTLPQEELAVAIEELTPFAEQNIPEAKMLLGNILVDNPDERMKGLSLLKEAEDAGDKIAYYAMGYCYLYGFDPINKDIDEAEKRFLEMNEEYEGEANSLLAELYTFCKVDYAKAFKYATAAAVEDEKEGYGILGLLYENGYGVKKNIQKAFENYKMAAAFGDALAMNQLGWLFGGNEESFESDLEQAFYWYNESAKKENALGANNVACCYKEGWGVKKDVEAAAEWFKKSAELGYVNAMIELGDYYQDVLVDLDKAESWYRKGAEIGDAECQNKLGVLLANNGNYEESNSWYQKAMEQNMPEAFNNYSLNLWIEDGVEENKQKAIELKEKAIELGMTEEINRLGVWYSEMGDYVKANECFRQAIENNDPWGYYNYAWNLWNGNATEMNKDNAIKFMTKAAEMGLEDAQAGLEEMQNELLSSVQDVTSSETESKLELKREIEPKNKETNKDIYFEKRYISIIKGNLCISLSLRNIVFKAYIKSDRYEVEPLGYNLKYNIHSSFMNYEKDKALVLWRDFLDDSNFYTLFSTNLQIQNMSTEVKYPIDIKIELYNNDNIVCQYTDRITIIRHHKVFGKDKIEIFD